MPIQAFLPEADFLCSFTLPKGGDTNQFRQNTQFHQAKEKEKQHFIFLSYANFHFGCMLYVIMYVPRKEKIR